jgi:MFS family permease
VTSAGPSARLPRAIWVLTSTAFLIAVGFGVMSPVLPTYVRLFGVSGFLVGLVVSVFAIVRLASNPVASRLLRYLGPREVLLTGTLLIAVTTFLLGVANAYWAILLWRGLSGVGSALFGVGSLALLFSVTPAHLRGRANALNGGGWVLGGMAGPAIGGLVAQISIHAPFFFYSATLFVSAAVVCLTIPRTPRREEADPARPYTLRPFLADRRYRAALAVNFANSWQTFGVRALLVPLFVVETLGLSTAHTGWALTMAAVANFACVAPAGWATDKLGRRPVLLFGIAVIALVSGCLAASDSFAVLVVLLCVYAVGGSGLGASVQALLADVVPPTAGPALAAYQMAGDAGLIVGPLLAGALIDVFPMAVAWAVGGVLFLVAGVLVATMRAPAEPAEPA